MARHMACHLVQPEMSGEAASQIEISEQQFFSNQPVKPARSERDVSGTQCSQCGAPISSPAGTCWTCGHEPAASEGAPAQAHEIAIGEPALVQPHADEPDQIPLVDWNDHAPVQASAAGTAAPAAIESATSAASAAESTASRQAAPAARTKGRSLALVGGAGVLACVMAMVVLQSLQPAASPQPDAATRPSPPAPVAPAPVVESMPVPTWVGKRQASWANDGSKTISFELQATRDVNVWMARVRPVLVVRCLYRTTEVFVATQSAASIEGQAGSHTVRLQVDDDQEVTQQWTDSVSGQELFSPNSVAFARRLASAERLRFSFTPYNAQPVTSEFSVQGFDKLAGLVGNTCGWKVDESSPPPSRVAKRR